MKTPLHMIFGFSLAFWGGFAGCHDSSDAASIATRHIVFPQEIPKDLMITLERPGCFMACPIYKLTITADGAVVFEGQRFVKKERATKKSAISKERLRQLMAEFDRVKFFSMEDDYSYGRPVCDSYEADLPSAYTSIRINGKSKTIKHDHGCTGPKEPKELTELEDKIDEIVNTAQWLPDRK
ncbi:MAG: hypothetical protein J2P52_09640 [Blastocatellia bacterium]|nr:hypothetical protein [Blastocatellia bacterium]